MKNPKALILSLYFFFPSVLFAQSLSGIWSGTLINDSLKRKQNFELGLSEYKGKITGYTYTTFIENDTFYYSIKRVSAERKDGMLVVEDEEMIGNNFPERRSKKVKQTTFFPIINDSTIDIAHGTWSTNQTKKYYSIGGRAELKIQPDEEQSDLAAHLKEMKVKTELAFQKPANKQRSAVIVKEPAIVFENGKQLPEKMYIAPETKSNEAALVKNDINKKIAASKLPAVPVTSPATEENNTLPENNKTTTENKVREVSKETATETKAVQSQNTIANNGSLPVVVNNNSGTIVKKTQEEKKETITGNPVKTQNAEINKSAAPATTNNNTNTAQTKQNDVAVKNALPEKQASTAVIKTETSLPVATQKTAAKQHSTVALPAIVAERNIDKAEELFFKGDSIILSLYDNGIVDGDTVSVFVNGENVLMKQKLKEAATRKTIYTTAYTDTIQIILFADNLGTIPPNTGLLTIRDGDDLYQVRFSADLNKNAAIVLRRRKNP